MGKRLALAGVGKWGANFLRTIVQNGVDELVLVLSSKSSQQLGDIAKSNAVLISDISQIDAHTGDIDGIIVATPPDVRPPIIRKLLTLGIPVLAEKPMSLHADTTRELVSLARSLDVPLLEDHIHLFSWPYLALVQQLGKRRPVYIESSGGNLGPRRNYSPLMDYAPHDLAMILQIFDCMPEDAQLDISDYRNRCEFAATIQLDFGELGSARVRISNISPCRMRQFSVSQGNDRWDYDDTTSGKLLCNGLPRQSSLSGNSPLTLLLEHFCGRAAFYPAAKLQWISVAVAEVLENLELQAGNAFVKH